MIKQKENKGVTVRKHTKESMLAGRLLWFVRMEMKGPKSTVVLAAAE